MEYIVSYTYPTLGDLPRCKTHLGQSIRRGTKIFARCELLAYRALRDNFYNQHDCRRYSGLSYDPFVATLLRWGFVTVALTPYAAMHRASLTKLTTAGLLPISIYAVLGLLLPGLMTFLAGLTTTAINMTIMYTLTPIVIYGMVAALGVERIQVSALAGLVIYTVGIALFLYYQKACPNRIVFRVGDLFAVFAVLCWSLYSAAFARKINDISLAR